ncbi:MAG: DNA polymerase III subunit delta, partial [Bacteroides sp.]|nr:DNA polymerase III subunit delta [Bacteroides sp.]
MKYGELAQHLNGVIAGVEKLAPVYVVVGEDDYLREHAIKTLSSLVEEDFADFNFSRFSADGGVADAIETLHTYPVFGQYRVVALSIFQKLSDEDKKALKAYIDAPDETSVLVAECDADAAKSLKGKNVASVDCSLLSEGELAVEIRKICKIPPERSIEDGAIAELARRTQGAMSRVASELVKLKSYADGTITREDVCAMVTEDFDFQIYELTDAVSKKDGDKAFRVLDTFYKNGVRSMRILNQLYDRYRKMLHAELGKGLSNDELGGLLAMSGGAVYHLKKVSSTYSQVRL